MKNIIFITLISILLFTVSCDTYPDYTVEYSDAYPFSGEWYVVDYDENGDSIVEPYLLYIYNKSYNPTKDSMWIDNRTGHPSGGSGDTYEFRYKIKCKADKDAFTFDCSNQGDVASGTSEPTSRSNIITITNSKVIILSQGIEDATPDSITFEILMTDSIGTVIGTIRTAGHRKTGWENPNYDDNMD